MSRAEDVVKLFERGSTMYIIRLIVIALVLAVPAYAETPAPLATPTPLGEQIAALKIDVPRVREIITLVARDENQPTKEIHDEFWGLILTRIHANPAALQRALTEGSDQAMVAQNAFWESLLLSAQSHRVVITKEYGALRTNIPKATFTADYTRMQNEMLTAAADGKPYIMSTGQPIYITVQKAKLTLARIGAAESRLDKLCDPEW